MAELLDVASILMLENALRTAAETAPEAQLSSCCRFPPTQSSTSSRGAAASLPAAGDPDPTLH